MRWDGTLHDVDRIIGEVEAVGGTAGWGYRMVDGEYVQTVKVDVPGGSVVLRAGVDVEAPGLFGGVL